MKSVEQFSKQELIDGEFLESDGKSISFSLPSKLLDTLISN